MSEPESLLFTVEDGIAMVKINRPEQRNAMSVEVANGLHDLWEKIDASPDIRVVIFTSAGLRDILRRDGPQGDSQDQGGNRQGHPFIHEGPVFSIVCGA